MSGRDELAELIAEAQNVPFVGVRQVKIANAVLAAGYRKPRVIETFDELDALPCGSIVRDEAGLALYRDVLGWNCTNGVRHIEREELERDAFPATVLHEGEA